MSHNFSFAPMYKVEQINPEHRGESAIGERYKQVSRRVCAMSHVFKTVEFTTTYNFNHVGRT